MKVKSKSNKILQILTAAFAVYYFAVIAFAFFTGSLSFSNLNDNLQVVLLFIFLAGFVLSWTREKMAGIILMIWNAGVWIYNLCLYREDDGGMFMGVPIIVIGALLLLQWYKTSKATVPSEKQQWKFVLRVLIINYAVLYGIVILSELSSRKAVDYFSLPYIIFPLLLLIFLVSILIE